MFTKYDVNGNAVFSYKEEINGWFYDCLLLNNSPVDYDFYPLLVADGDTFACYADYGNTAKVAEFTL